MVKMRADYFTRYAVIVAFLGLALFNVGGFLAMALYPYPFSLLEDSYSEVGAIVDGNYGAGVLSVGLALAGALEFPIVVVYAREVVAGGRARSQPFALIGLAFQLLARVAVVFVGAFPTLPWRGAHDAAAILWIGGETFGVIFLMIELFRWRKELWWAIGGALVIAAGTIAWIPYATGAWEGMGVSEFVTMTLIYAFNVALWIRAYKGGAAIGKARGGTNEGEG
ncbi:MAG: hypothetical protein JW839_11165 [Candidatus Lokiarchaeota archaeon]|nr:hypothetical protein [Candidatus Lokiarchaeota archaeon]